MVESSLGEVFLPQNGFESELEMSSAGTMHHGYFHFHFQAILLPQWEEMEEGQPVSFFMRA